MVITQRLDGVFQALADPTRRRILEQLARGDRPVMDLAGRFDMTQPAVTKHLNVLESAGLIRRRRIGRQRMCQLKPDAFKPTLDWIRRCQAYWNQRLDALEEFLAEEKHRGRNK